MSLQTWIHRKDSFNFGCPELQEFSLSVDSHKIIVKESFGVYLLDIGDDLSNFDSLEESEDSINVNSIDVHENSFIVDSLDPC